MSRTRPIRPITAAVLIGVAVQLLFTIRLGVPSAFVFDETHYVPAARALVESSYPANIEHPLLAKWLIAQSIRLFGDAAFGWRFASTLAGTATVLSVFALLQSGLGRLRTSVTGALLTVLSLTVYVQARIAMLDTFMAAFLMAALAAFVWAMRRGGWGRWIGCAVLTGCAIGCKWAALPYAGAMGLAFLFLKRERPGRFAGVPLLAGAAAFGVVAIATYLATFAPAFFYARDAMTWDRLLPFQLMMYDRQTSVLPHHTYQSDWWSWPLLIRPIWYLYEPVDGAQRGILMIGNPAIMWGGLVAVAACAWAWIKAGARAPLAAALLWGWSLAIYAIIPKSLGFYYYYYPSGIFLCVALAVAMDHWRGRMRHWDEAYLAACAIVAIYFFPVVSAMPLWSPGAFHRWTWFPTWV